MKVIPFLVKLVSHHPASPRHTLTPLATTIIKIQKHNTSRLLSFPSPFQNEQIGKMKHSLSYIMKLKTPNLSNITSRKFNQKSFAFHFHQNCCGYVKMHLRSIQPHWSCFSFFSPSSSTSSPSSLGSFLFPFLFFWDFPFLSAGSSVLPFFFFFDFSFLDFSFLLCFLSFRLLLQKSLCCSQSSSWHFWLQKRA